MKHCTKCNTTKPVTEFAKKTSSKDGLQYNCKQCNKQDNLKFRTIINPQHHDKWQRANWDKFIQHMKAYRKADKIGTIYGIINPLGETYVGMTKTNFKVRMLEHRTHYRKACNNKRSRLPLLHNSFDTYGIENHKFITLLEIDTDREALHQIEVSFIKQFIKENKSLNKRIN